MVAWRKFTLTLEDVARMTLLPIFGKTNVVVLVGVVLEEEDGVKLKYLTFVMIASGTSGKSV